MDEEATTDFQDLLSMCKATNNRGGCYELFYQLKILNRNFSRIPNKCLAGIVKQKQVKDAIFKSLDLLIRIAWGEKPPETSYDMFNWLSESDKKLYCQYKRTTIKALGTQAWQNFYEVYFTELPGSENLSRQEAWPKMLVSLDCKRYL